MHKSATDRRRGALERRLEWLAKTDAKLKSATASLNKTKNPVARAERQMEIADLTNRKAREQAEVKVLKLRIGVRE